jgi:hypothetical protein
VVPAQLLFIPAETAAASVPAGERAGLSTRWLRPGLAIGVLAAALLPAWIVAAPAGIPRAAALALTATGAACALISPVQDHLRRMLHVAGRSPGAAGVSLVHLVVVVVTIAAGWGTGVGAGWIPFGALALGNVVSLAAALWMLRGAGRDGHGRPELQARVLFAQGRWLVLASVIGPASAFVGVNLVGHLAGAASLGLAEAARVIGAPVIVLATGLSAVLGPRAARAAREQRPDEAGRLARRFHAIVLAGGVAYLAIAGFAWALNPLAPLVPRAFVVPGLAAAAIAAATAQGGIYARRYEIIGLGQSKSIARIDMMGAALRVAISASAVFVGAFAIPLALGLQAMYRRVGYRLVLRQLYRSRKQGARESGSAPLPAAPGPASTADY